MVKKSKSGAIASSKKTKSLGNAESKLSTEAESKPKKEGKVKLRVKDPAQAKPSGQVTVPRDTFVSDSASAVSSLSLSLSSPSPSLSAADSHSTPPAPSAEFRPLDLTRPAPTFLIGAALSLAFVFLWWNHAWLGDDINITIRSVLNFVDGLGIVWNPGERVQAFTHPLWFFVLVIAQFLSRHIFHAIFVISFVCSFGAFLGLLRTSKHALSMMLVSFLLLSQSFNDYTTSGLENPLSYLLIFLTLKRFYAGKIDVWFYLLISLTFLNRMDHILILLPLTLWGLKLTKFRLRPLLIASIPPILWLLFSFFYFGFPLPNTFLGKLNTGYPAEEYHDRFLNYLDYSYQHDPVTLVVIGLAILLPFVLKTKEMLLALGLILYLFYLRTIGGDFMGGRLFSIPVFVATYGLMTLANGFDWSTKARQVSRLALTGSLAAIFLACVSVGTSPFSNRIDYKKVTFEKGVADERGYYFEHFSLAKGDILDTFPRPSADGFSLMCGLVGLYSLSHMDSYIYDSCGLGSPYSSRLPAVYIKNWRIGHHERHLVPGFPCWLKNKDLKFDDPELTRLLNDIRLVATGPLFDSGRLDAIGRLNFTSYAYDKKVLAQTTLPNWQSGRDCPIQIQPFQS